MGARLGEHPLDHVATTRGAATSRRARRCSEPRRRPVRRPAGRASRCAARRPRPGAAARSPARRPTYSPRIPIRFEWGLPYQVTSSACCSTDSAVSSMSAAGFCPGSPAWPSTGAAGGGNGGTCGAGGCCAGTGVGGGCGACRKRDAWSPAAASRMTAESQARRASRAASGLVWVKGESGPGAGQRTSIHRAPAYSRMIASTGDSRAARSAG